MRTAADALGHTNISCPGEPGTRRIPTKRQSRNGRSVALLRDALNLLNVVEETCCSWRIWD